MDGEGVVHLYGRGYGLEASLDGSGGTRREDGLSTERRLLDWGAMRTLYVRTQPG